MQVFLKGGNGSACRQKIRAKLGVRGALRARRTPNFADHFTQPEQLRKEKIMNGLKHTRLTLILMACGACLVACEGGGGVVSTMPAVFTLAPTQPSAATLAPAALALPRTPASPKATAAGAPATPAAATKPAAQAVPAAQATPVPDDASGDAADQALTQLNKDLGSTDTMGDVNDAGDTAVTQGLDQLDKSLNSTDTLTDVSKLP